MRYELTRIRSHFTRYGCRVVVYNSDGTIARRGVDVIDCNGRKIGRSVEDCALSFYGNDGRKVRANAEVWAKRQIGE